MSILPSDYLAKMRADVLTMLPDAVTVQRVTTTTDSAGFTSESWATVETTVGRVDPINRQTSVALVAEREARRLYYQLTLPHDTTCLSSDRVQIGGITYEILQLSSNHSWNVSTRALIAVVE